MSEATTATQEMGTIRVELEVSIEAPPERVWQALVNEMGAWWRKDFYCAGGQRFVIEPRVGGRIYEDDGKGGGLLWYTIQVLTAPKTLQLIGHLSPPWGGPALAQTRFELEPAGKATVVRVTDRLFGAVSAKLKKDLQEGWTLLIAGALKPYVEGKPEAR